MTSGGFNKYYQDDLSYLREMGRDFSEAHPEAAPFLAEQGSDPDVERLLEGFAFLSGRIRQKLDDELPEITHALMQLLWPHYLRPLPAMAIVQFQATSKAGEGSLVVPRGTEIDSVPVDGTPCRFRTTYDVPFHPAALEGTDLKTSAPPHLRLTFRVVQGAKLSQTPTRSLRLYLHGEPTVARALYLLMLRYTERLVLRPAGSTGGDRSVTLPREAIRPVGFAREEALLPTPSISFEGFRLLHEYFTFPAKFLFVDILQLERLAELGDAPGFEMVFELRGLPEAMPDLGTAGVLVGCTPVVNIFGHHADPIRIDHRRTEYKVRPSGATPEHHEVYDVLEVHGQVKGTPKPRKYRPFFGFDHSLGVTEGDGAFYRTRLEPAVGVEGTDTYLTLIAGGEAAVFEEVETVTADLLCTNRQLPSKLRVGDIKVPTPKTPAFARFRSISQVAPSVPPPLESDVYWRLLSHLALNYLSLASAEGLRGILGLYNFRAAVDRKAEQAHRLLLQGIREVSTRPATRVFHGSALRGTAIDVGLEEESFSGEGDLYLFGTLLNEFFSLYASINTFTELTVRGLKYGEEYRWPARLGGRIIP